MDSSKFKCLTFDQWVDVTGLFLSLVGIVVGSIIAVRVVKSLQYRLTDSRVLKDYYINEIRDIRKEYRSYLTELLKGNVEAQTVISWFKIMSIRINDMMTSASAVYHIKVDSFSDYHLDLLSTITDAASFVDSFSNKTRVLFDSEETKKIIQIQKENIHLFNEAILFINNAKFKGKKMIRKEEREKKRKKRIQL